eukprot:224036-Prorocentrum_minimum.AAC.1
MEAAARSPGRHHNGAADPPRTPSQKSHVVLTLLLHHHREARFSLFSDGSKSKRARLHSPCLYSRSTAEEFEKKRKIKSRKTPACCSRTDLTRRTLSPCYAALPLKNSILPPIIRRGWFC